MSESARLSFFRVTKCGYYKRGEPSPAFGSFQELATELRSWTSGRPLGETCPFAASPTTGLLRAYCLTMASSQTNQTNQTHLLTLWNEVPSSKNAVASVDPTSVVGAPNLTLTKLPKGNIPGFPTYFWLIPHRSLLATVALGSRFAGKRVLITYLKSFLAKFTRFVVTQGGQGPGAETEVLGYRERSEDPLLHLSPAFALDVAERVDAIKHLSDNRARIKKVIRKNRLQPVGPGSQNALSVFLSLLGIRSWTAATEELKVKYEIGYCPSEDEFKEILEQWRADQEDSWDDVGFLLDGESSPRWLSHARARESIELQLKSGSGDLFRADDLLGALDPQFNRLTRDVSPATKKDDA